MSILGLKLVNRTEKIIWWENKNLKWLLIYIFFTYIIGVSEHGAPKGTWWWKNDKMREKNILKCFSVHSQKYCVPPRKCAFSSKTIAFPKEVFSVSSHLKNVLPSPCPFRGRRIREPKLSTGHDRNSNLLPINAFYVAYVFMYFSIRSKKAEFTVHRSRAQAVNQCGAF